MNKKVKAIGLLTLSPIAIFFIFALTEFFSSTFELYAVVVLSLMVSGLLMYIGIKKKIKFMTLWFLAFLFVIPISNVIFWLIYLRNKSETSSEQ